MAEIDDRLKTRWQCKNCGYFFDNFQRANEHAVECPEYKIGDKVEVQLTWDWENIWASGGVVRIGLKHGGGKLVFVNTEFGVFSQPINNKLRKKK